MSCIFDEEIIRSCVMDTFLKRIWGAWQVLIGRAGILLLIIKKTDFFRKD